MAESLPLPGQVHIRAQLVAVRTRWPSGRNDHARWRCTRQGLARLLVEPRDAGLAPTLDWTLPAGASAGALYSVPQTLLIGLMNHVTTMILRC
jgi:hypothetical protein